MRLRIGITVALGCLAAGPTVCAHENVIILGDSITAGVSYLSLSDDSARESWANRVLAALGEPPDLPRLESPAPADFARLARDGWGFDAWRFVASALPWVLDRDSRFVAGEPRSIVAVPGETVHEALTQSSRDPGVGSTASILGPLLLPEGLTAIETAEASARDLDWAILWLGANDLLSAFRLVGTASPPTPDQFARDYEELARRLGALLAPGTPPSHLLLGTLPDVTEVPIWRPLPPGARDEHGEPFETGSVASAFLVHFRNDRFERGREAFAPADVAAVRELVREYDVRIRAIADRLGATVVDFGALLKELAREPEWDAIDSPWFSPDLLHPSPRTHAAIAARVLGVMGEVGSPALAGATPPVPVRPDPTSAEASRRFALMRTAMLGTGAYSFPPRPAVRLSVDVGGRLDDGRDDVVLSPSLLLALERPPLPAFSRWNSRTFVAGRVAAEVRSDRDLALAADSPEFRAGWAAEPIGAWHWRRVEGGWRWARRTGSGWWARGEWRAVYAEVRADAFRPTSVEAGLRLGATTRTGRNGN